MLRKSAAQAASGLRSLACDQWRSLATATQVLVPTGLRLIGASRCHRHHRHAPLHAPLQEAPHFLGRQLPGAVTIVEVGPRDGLQNEPTPIPADTKVALIEMLANAGLPVVEATSFVSPTWVPQLADAAEVLQRIQRRPGVRYPVLTPNMKGFENALKAGADEVAIFTAASEAFNQRNLNCSVDESLRKFDDIMAAAQAENVAVRGYVSCVVGCPYQGEVPPQDAARVAHALLSMGCYEISMVSFAKIIEETKSTSIHVPSPPSAGRHNWRGHAWQCGSNV